MKKYLVLLAAVLALSVGTLAAGHLYINSAKDKMDIRETVIKGDPAAAAGLAVTCHTRDWEGHLQWDTAFTPGRTEEAKSVFRLSGAGEFSSSQSSSWANLEQATSSFSTQGIDLDLQESDEHWFLMKPVRDVASRTAAGESRTETVRLEDYYDYFPLSLDTYSKEYPQNSIGVTSEECGWLKEYFRVRIDQPVWRQVTVEKDSEGRVTAYRMTPEDGSREGELFSNCLITERGIFLIAETVDSDGEFDNRLECRDGAGVHLIQYREGRENEDSVNYGDLFEPRLFYPTGSARTLWLGISPDERELLLYTWEDGRLVLTVLDPATGEVLQRLDLIEAEEENWFFSVTEGDGLYLAVTRADTFSLVSREGGRYEQVLTGALELESAEDWSVLRSDSALAWDGRHMALASTNPSAMLYYQGTRPDSAIGVGVWDADGPCFLGTYRCGLSFEPVNEYEYARPPLSLVFTGK